MCVPKHAACGDHVPLCTRDPRRVQRARRLLDDAAHLRGNEREQRHVAAVRAAAGGDYEAASDTLDQVLANHPRDALALHVANTFDYFTGNPARMLARVEAAWPAWSADMPGYPAMLTSHAFALVECGHYAQAEETVRLALAIDPLDIRAHHVMAHVFEMTDRPADGVRWMTRHAASTGADRLFSAHCRWHLAVFHLALSQTDQALTIHDEFVEARPPADVADLIDAAALHRLGGSHAQRDVLNLTLMRAIEGIRRPAQRVKLRPAKWSASAAHRPSTQAVRSPA